MYEYPFGNGQQLNLDWFLAEWKNLLAAWEAEKNGIDGALQAEIDRAEAALADVFAARDAAAQSAANALESKNAAEQSAEDAGGYLATVRADTNAAQDAARNAAQSERNAAESAQTALASKNTAANSERNAAQSEANANLSKNAAAQSAAEALANKNAAAQSAEDAEDAAASVEASTQQITTNANGISNLKESINEYIFTYPITIEQGYYGATDGLPIASDTWCRTKYYVPNDIALDDTFTNIGIQLMILAYDKITHDYIGLWNPAQQIFTKEYNSGNFVTSLNIGKFCAKYPNYCFHILFYRGAGITKEYIYNNIVFTSIYSAHNIIAKQLATMVADTNLVPNDLRIVNNTLYRVTANIANGGTLTVGTNVIATTVAEILKSLLN